MKRERHAKIKEIIESQNVETQEELSELLLQQGFKTTQATVSRDIRELRLTKMPGANGKQKYVLLHQEDDQMLDKYTRVLREGFLSMDKAQNILVIKTVSGMAMAVAAAIDGMKMKEVVGCIAGDDTIMAAIRTEKDTDMVMRVIEDCVR